MRGATATWIGALRALCAVTVAWLALGCGTIQSLTSRLTSKLRVEPLATSAQAPSNVMVYVAVTHAGKPLIGLRESSFTLYEDEQRLAGEETILVLLERDVAAVHHAALLLDARGLDSEPGYADQLEQAATAFVRRVRRTQPVSVWAFDGGEEIRRVAEFAVAPAKAGDAGPSELPELRALRPADPSRNLHGAVIAGLNQLEARLMSVKRPIRVGTLVVFTRGPDLAGRVSIDQMLTALDNTDYEVYAIGVGEPDADFRLDDVGRTGTERAGSLGSLTTAFEAAADTVEASWGKYYLLSYCSPARAGVRTLRVEVAFEGSDGTETRGGGDTQFDASGFQPGCDPRAPLERGTPAMHAATEPAPKRPRGRPPRAPAPDKAPAKPAAPADDDAIVPPPDAPGYAPK